MKKLFIFLFLVSIISCNDKSTSVKDEEKIFDVQNISKLELDNFDFFWEGEEIKDIENSKTGIFSTIDNFLESLRYNSQNKMIEISVFKSKNDAILGMETRRNNVACLIEEGDSNLFSNNKWWKSDCIPDMIFLNQWNTIIEVGCYNENYQEIETFLIQSVKELASRVDKLSQ
jgi:hypothetical protein